MKPFRILIVDDHAILRMGLASMLESEPDMKVIGEADDGKSAIEATMRLRPDLVIMDLIMPNMNGAEAVRQILSSRPKTKVMILTSFGSSEALSQALAAGAHGAMLKNAAFPELLAGLRAIATGGQAISAEITRFLGANPPIGLLSPRQQDVLSALVRGLSNKDIARLLNLSPDVVKEYLSSLFEKIGAANRTEAVAIALRRQLLKNT